jgi:hypothetical protein
MLQILNHYLLIRPINQMALKIQADLPAKRQPGRAALELV